VVRQDGSVAEIEANESATAKAFSVVRGIGKRIRDRAELPRGVSDLPRRD
jgi:hypothetical protein